MQGRPEPNFSLSGLKTALRLEAEKIAPLTQSDIADLCASFQAAVVDMVVDRTRVGLRAFREIAGHPKALVVAGGVAANQAMRDALQRMAVETGLRMVAPPLALCGDNGAMIAWAGLERLRLGLVDDISAPARAPAGPSIRAATRREPRPDGRRPSALPEPAPGAPRLPTRRRLRATTSSCGRALADQARSHREIAHATRASSRALPCTTAFVPPPISASLANVAACAARDASADHPRRWPGRSPVILPPQRRSCSVPRASSRAPTCF